MMESLQSYLRRWDLSDPVPLAKTFTSDLYKVRLSGRTAVLKLLSEIGRKDERGGAAALQWYGGQGAIELLDHDYGAMLLEYVEGDDLSKLVGMGKDDDASKIIADVLNKLHFASKSPFPGELATLRRRFKSLFDKVDRNEPDMPPIYGRAAAVAYRLLSDPSPDYVLHGDIHHENIRYSSKRGWLAIDPKGVIGDRVYDAANALCNPPGMPEIVNSRERMMHQAEIIATGMNVERDRLLSYVFAYSCLSACWSVEDKQDPKPALITAEISEICMNETASPQLSKTRRAPHV